MVYLSQTGKNLGDSIFYPPHKGERWQVCKRLEAVTGMVWQRRPVGAKVQKEPAEWEMVMTVWSRVGKEKIHKKNTYAWARWNPAGGKGSERRAPIAIREWGGNHSWEEPRASSRGGDGTSYPSSCNDQLEGILVPLLPASVEKQAVELTFWHVQEFSDSWREQKYIGEWPVQGHIVNKDQKSNTRVPTLTLWHICLFYPSPNWEVKHYHCGQSNSITGLTNPSS